MGCDPVSEGCAHCYARAMIRRFAGRKGWPETPNGVTLFPERLEQPLRWRKPRHVFVCSMSDLFHQNVPFDFIDRVWRVMDNCPQHTFMVLTKRPARMLDYWNRRADIARSMGVAFSNVWLGVTAENQQRADERIPVLLDTPAAVRFVSIEPMLGPVNLLDYMRGFGRFEQSAGLDWIIVGGETGPGARLMRAEWALSVAEQCTNAGVPFFFKK